MAVLGGALAGGWTDRLALSMTESQGAPLEIRARGGPPVRSPAFRVAVRTMRAQLGANPAVETVRERRRAATRRSVLLLVRFSAAAGTRGAAIARIERNLDPGPLTLSFGGPLGEVRAAKDAALDDLVLLLLAALPAVALLAIATLGLRPAGAALLGAGAAAALAAIACLMLAELFEVSWLALVASTGGATLLSLQLCATVRAGASAATACCAALAAAATFAAAALLGVGYLGTMGLGGALGALLAAPAALTAMGAAASIEPGGVRGTGAWRSFGELVAWSRVVAGLVALLGLVVLVPMLAPAQRLATAAIGAASAPAIGAPELVAAGAGAALATVVLAAAAGRSAGRAILATAAIALPPAAIAGLLVASFQEGWLEGPLGYRASGTLQLGSLAAAVCAVAAVGAAQAVALAAAGPRGAGTGADANPADGPQALAEAVARCGPPATLACLAGAAAGASLGFSSELFVKEFGLAVAAGLLLQLLVVQALLAPALLRLGPDRRRAQ